MNNVQRELKTFLKQNNAYCSFDRVPVKEQAFMFQLANGVFRKLVGIKSGTSPMKSPVFYNCSKQILDAISDKAEAFLDGDAKTPVYLVAKVTNVKPEILNHRDRFYVDKNITMVSLQNEDEVRAYITDNINECTVFFVQHFLPEESVEVYNAVTRLSYNVNFTGKDSFDGHAFKATLGVYDLNCEQGEAEVDTLGNNLKKAFGNVEAHIKSEFFRGRMISSYVFGFDNINSINKLKLYGVSNSVPVDISVSISALTKDRSNK